MKPYSYSISFFAAAAVIASASLQAGEYASRSEAEAMVAKAVKHIKADGKDAAYADFTGKKAGWVDRDLYVVVYDMNGKVLAHGQNEKQVGKELISLKDADGKEFVKERVDLAKSKGKFWQDYKFTDPMTKKILPKSMYCEKLDDTAVCAGVYKR
ncbi:MAG: cache domain-containing protein [Betaproteobacteria bacterium]|nr:cache domain-containing protein [Betaproteobacteria bacterium]